VWPIDIGEGDGEATDDRVDSELSMTPGDTDGLHRGPSRSSALSCVVGGWPSSSCGFGGPTLQEAEVRKRHVVVLSEEERARLYTMIGRGVARPAP
jgi:hypothetical protein